MKTTTLLETVWRVLWSLAVVACALGAGSNEQILFVAGGNDVR